MGTVGGARPGAGRPGTNLDKVIRYDRDPDTGEQIGRTITDVIVETMAGANFLKDAAARIGFPVETLRAWRTLGSAAIADILAGRRRLSECSAHERRCMTLVQRMEAASAGAPAPRPP